MDSFPTYTVINNSDSVPIKGTVGDIYFDTSKGGTFYMNDQGNWVQAERYNKWKKVKKILLEL